MATGDFCKNYNYQNSSKNYLEHLNVERTKTNNSKVKKSENLEENQSFNNIVYGSVITPISSNSRKNTTISDRLMLKITELIK